MTGFDAYLVYAVAWSTFGASHSVLACGPVKTWFRPLLGACYRLAYNAFAIAHLALVWLVGAWMFGDGGAFALPPYLDSTRIGVSVAGWLVLVIALRGYDLGRLAGTRQIRNHLNNIVEPDDEPLRLDGLHRYVRHPLYTAGFLILWGRVDGDFELATALWGSIYLLIGTWFEERRLVRLYADSYLDYRRRVPAFLPWKGRAV